MQDTGPLADLRTAMQRRDLGACLVALQALEAMEPTRADWPYERGVLLYEDGDEEGARRSYEAALAKDPSHLASLVNLGRIVDDAGDWTEALALYDRALQVDGGDGDDILWSNRGNTLMSLGRFDEAVDSFERSLALVPDTVAVRGRQTALGWAGRVDEANAARPESGSRYDRGVLHQLERPLDDGRLIVRFWEGRHTRPDWLLERAESMIEQIAGFAESPPGLEDGVSIAWLWSSLTIRIHGSDRVVCEPTYDNDGLAWDVGFTLQTELMQQMTHSIVEVAPERCTDRDAISVVPGCLADEEVWLARVEPPGPGHSGWLVAPTREELGVPLSDDGLRVYSTGGLVRLRHPLIKVLMLPTGWIARFQAHAVVNIIDDQGVERWDVE